MSKEEIKNQKIEDWKKLVLPKTNTEIEISNLGRIRSKTQNDHIFYHKPIKLSSQLSVRIRYHRYPVHKLVALAWLNWDGKHTIKFKDGNRFNVEVNNLEIQGITRQKRECIKYDQPESFYSKSEIYVPENHTYYRTGTALLKDMGIPDNNASRMKLNNVKNGYVDKNVLTFTPLKVEKTNLVTNYIFELCTAATRTSYAKVQNYVEAIKRAKEVVKLPTNANIQIQDLANKFNDGLFEYTFKLNLKTYKANIVLSKTIYWNKITEIFTIDD